MPKMVNFKKNFCGETVLPDRSLLIGQKLVENAKNENLKWYIFSDFQSQWLGKVGESNICPLHMHEVVRGTWKSDEQSDHAGNSNLTMIPLATPSKPSNPCSTINHGLDAINTIIQHPFWTVAWENPNLLKYTHHRMKISDFLTKTLKSQLKSYKI